MLKSNLTSLLVISTLILSSIGVNAQSCGCSYEIIPSNPSNNQDNGPYTSVHVTGAGHYLVADVDWRVEEDCGNGPVVVETATSEEFPNWYSMRVFTSTIGGWSTLPIVDQGVPGNIDVSSITGSTVEQYVQNVAAFLNSQNLGATFSGSVFPAGSNNGRVGISINNNNTGGFQYVSGVSISRGAWSHLLY